MKVGKAILFLTLFTLGLVLGLVATDVLHVVSSPHCGDSSRNAPAHSGAPPGIP